MGEQEIPGQRNIFGEEPSGEPTELTFKKKAEFGVLTLKFKVDAGLDMGHAAHEIETSVDGMISDLEQLQDRLRNHELYQRSTLEIPKEQ